MNYELPPLTRGILIKRYKRFLADVELGSGKKITAHCPNSGSMKGCAVPGARVWLSRSDNPSRKLKYTWELVEAEGTMVGINTQVPNKLVKRSIENNIIKELSGYDRVKAEVKTGGNSRLDLLLETSTGEKCYVEIKNCTLVEDGIALFPDAVTTRGQKHLDELQRIASLGHRAAVFFLIQRMDAKLFKPADMIDKAYADKLKRAFEWGVEIITRDTTINTRNIRIHKSIPVSLS